MNLNRTPNPLNRDSRNKENENWDRIERKVGQINSSINNLVLESGGDSNLEVVQARGGKPVLNERLNEIEDDINSSENKLVNLEQNKADKFDVNEIKQKLSGVTINDLSYPLYIAHRGGSNIFPENSIEAFKNSIDLGLKIIEMDVQQLADGSLAVMHDTTVDRTTNKTGKVNNYSTMGFRNLKITSLPNWGNINPPLLEDVLNTFKNTVCYMIESKDKKSAGLIADLVKKYNLEEYVVIQSFDLQEISSLKDEGIALLYGSNTTNPLEVKAAGADYIAVSTSVTESYINQSIDAGLKVLVYTVNRRYERDKFLNFGVHGFFSDDPIYVQGLSPSMNMDTFGEQVYTHGQIAAPDFDLSRTNRGEFISSDYFGWTKLEIIDGVYYNNFILQGWAGELKSEFKLTAKMKLLESEHNSYWGSIAFCTPKDIWTDNGYENLSEGYHLLLRESGLLQLYKRTAQNGSVKLDEVQSDNLQIDETVELKIAVESNRIIITRVDTDHSFIVNDSTYRGGYLHLGRRVNAILFKDIYIE